MNSATTSSSVSNSSSVKDEISILEKAFESRYEPPGSFDTVSIVHSGSVAQAISIDAFVKAFNVILRVRNHYNKLLHSTTDGGSVDVFVLDKLRSLVARIDQLTSQHASYKIQTRLSYGPAYRNYIQTPPASEITPQYLAAIQKIQTIEASLKPDEQTTDVNNANNNSSNNNGVTRKRRATHQLSHQNNKRPRDAWDALMQCNLVNGTIKSQLQGGESFTRQRALNHIRFNNVRLLLLTDDTLQPDEVRMPEWTRGLFEIAPFVLVIKRDPVLGRLIIATKVVYTTEDAMYLNSIRLLDINADTDGDALVLYVVYSSTGLKEAVIFGETNHNVYRHINNVTLNFSQHHIMYVHRHEKEFMRAINPAFAAIYSMACLISDGNTKDKLKATSLAIASMAAPHSNAAYEFCRQTTQFCLTKNKEDVLPLVSLGDQTFADIYQSGAEGEETIANRILYDLPLSNIAAARECFAFHNQLIGTSDNISAEHYVFFQLVQSMQHLKLDAHRSVIYDAGNVEYNIGHINDYMTGDIIFSDIVEACIDNDLYVPTTKELGLNDNTTTTTNLKRPSDDTCDEAAQPPRKRALVDVVV